MAEPRDARTAEYERLREVSVDNRDHVSWRFWGPYVSERSWGTVREDYSARGEAWDFLPHDLARSKAYRWGEDGIAGICDRYQVLVFAPAFWNGRDLILKERLFGLVPSQGNHGEDVKEYYFHVDNTPTHSFMKYRYKYAQAAFPYQELIEENRAREGRGFEYELLDTGVFDGDRYFDITIEYGKFDPEDLGIRITAVNRGPDAAALHVLPHLWFRNTWAWGPGSKRSCGEGGEPVVRLAERKPGGPWVLEADDRGGSRTPGLPIPYCLGRRYLYAPAPEEVLFTGNETHAERVFGAGHRSRRPYVKDAFHRHVVDGEAGVLDPSGSGTKAALHYRFGAIRPGGRVSLVLRLSDRGDLARPLDEVEPMLRRREEEADAFYETIHPEGSSPDVRLVQRRALAGLLWTRQFYYFDVHPWLEGDDPANPPPEERKAIRNTHWRHLNSKRILVVCDKWEYPWFAAWDLAFHCVALALVDPQSAKDQLWYLLFEQFQHPNGQLPAYEWDFSDLNPPVHAWAVWRVYHMDADFKRRHHGKAEKDRAFLERCYHKLLVNFTWWVNKVDRLGNNIFEGGFLGLDNITVFDRSKPCTDGSVLEQADATGWMGMFCLNLMRIALELAVENPVYESMATKFFQHYAYVASAMKHMGGRDYALWDDEDGFFYDVLRRPDGSYARLRVRSLVGLIPLFAVERLETDWIERFPEFKQRLNWFLCNRPDLVGDVIHEVRGEDGEVRTHVLTVINRSQLQRMLARLWDPEEFLSEHGVRSLSRTHRDHPFEFSGASVRYEPAESESKLKGGNSNWRGPVWFPLNFLLIESLRKLGKAWGDRDGFDAPGGGRLPYRQMAGEIARRLVRIFLRDEERGKRPVYGGCQKFQEDPYWRDELLFYEYFHGDNGAGLGASHQTGWTALAASLIDEWPGQVVDAPDRGKVDQPPTETEAVAFSG